MKYLKQIKLLLMIVIDVDGYEFRIPSNRVFWIGDRALIHELCGMRFILKISNCVYNVSL